MKSGLRPSWSLTPSSAGAGRTGNLPPYYCVVMPSWKPCANQLVESSQLQETSTAVCIPEKGTDAMVLLLLPQDGGQRMPWAPTSNSIQSDAEAPSLITGPVCHGTRPGRSLRVLHAPLLSSSPPQAGSPMTWPLRASKSKSLHNRQLPICTMCLYPTVQILWVQTEAVSSPTLNPLHLLDLSDGGLTVPPTAQPGNCRNQPLAFCSPQQYRMMCASIQVLKNTILVTNARKIQQA